jgi:CDP-diacylglycerol--glycerol-3-phosphate 3-phosphatidyltransferase
LSTLVLMVALLLTVLISYTKARAEGLGIQCRVGFMDRGIRVVYLIVWCGFIVFVPSQIQITLWAGLTLYCGLTFFTVLQRIFHVRDQCRRTDSASLTERQ